MYVTPEQIQAAGKANVESFLAVAHITLVHIPGILGRPGLSPLSAMVLNGKISPRVLAEEHGDELNGLVAAQEAVS